jgi:undecaprenyl-diphosphatase
VALAVALAAAAIFLLWRRRHLLVPLLVALAGTQATVQAVKHLVRRPRPRAELVAQGAEASFAFPSGASAIAVALYGFLAYALARDAATRAGRAGAALAALAVVLAVGLSRLYLGAHFPTDVLGGYLAGLLWLVVGVSLAELLRARSPGAAAPP